MSTFGEQLKVSLWGESHGPSVGITIHQMPANVALDLYAIQAALKQRNPHYPWQKARHEDDELHVASGLFEGKTTGAPLTLYVLNQDHDSKSYTPNEIRPGHADYPAYIKTQGAFDYRGGGHYSGRLTAPLIILGDIARQLLLHKKVRVFSQVKQIHHLKTTGFDLNNLNDALFESLQQSDFPVQNKDHEHAFKAHIEDIYQEGDSVGGVIETAIELSEVGVGEPFFDSVESLLSHLMFAIPGVKGILFGSGLALAQTKGSEQTDTPLYKEDSVTYETHHNGGVIGGLSQGTPIHFETVIKASASIKKLLPSINLRQKTNTISKLKGSYDPCIVPRALWVVNALSYYAVLELLIRKEGFHWLT